MSQAQSRQHSRPAHPAAGRGRGLPQARSAHARPQSRHVRGRHRLGSDHASLLRDLIQGGPDLGFSFQINLWLWFTVLFANFAEAVAEGRGKAQADSLRKARTEIEAKRLTSATAATTSACPAPA